MSEFSLIDIIRARCAHARRDVTLGIGDDAALLGVPRDRRLAVCTDTLVEGMHFLHGTASADIGWKSLAVNLSDLAAMGAEPAWALLALTLPNADVRFVEGFADGFAGLARQHGVALVGGDTTQGPLAVTVTALGFVPRDAALTRAGACAGDAVFVTDTLGDAAGALGLSLPPLAGVRGGAVELPAAVQADSNARGRTPGAGLSGERTMREHDNDAEGGWGELSERLHRPQPRIAAGLALRGIATACIDVSDGLLADLGHVCETSGVGAEIVIETLPLSAQLRESFDADTCRGFALAGGDDYELCFTAPESRTAKVEAVFAGLGLRVTRIGRIVTGRSVRVLDAQGNTIETLHAGWEHFAQ